MTDPRFHLSPRALLALVWASIRQPRPVARWLADLGLPVKAGWTILALVTVLSVLFERAASLAMSGGDPEMALLPGNPLVQAALQGLVQVFTVFAVWRIGGLFGGSGRFDQALLLIGWCQFVMLCILVVQLVTYAVLPPLGEVVSLVGLMLVFWLFTNFVAELHGFRNIALVLLGVVGTALVFSFALATLLAMLGVTVSGVSNV